MMADDQKTQCCIVGGGPAGLMLGFLLARAGVDTIVLEKHADFLRDFRDDTIHPSTLELIHELGLLDEFLKLPHERVETLAAWFGDEKLTLADFRGLPTRCDFIAMMPQWDFLNFIAERANRLPNFRLLMRAEGKSLIRDRGRVTGVAFAGTAGEGRITADLVVAADGRYSAMREAAGLVATDLGAPMDVLWFRLPVEPSDSPETSGHFGVGLILVHINRGDYWQCAFVIPKGGNEKMRAQGLGHFRGEIGRIAPFLRDRVAGIADWDQVKLLTVTVDRLGTWYRDGLLCIGDAAHAMSPVGGVGINLAVQDAVAAANILAEPLRRAGATMADLQRVQARRMFPTRVTQRLQLAVQNRVISAALGSGTQMAPPLLLRAMAGLPLLKRIPARLIGLGVRPEHIRSLDMASRG
jgi:2-polyprenyl-6-methoxyphenol hydroxylase-like FAD-dependent oxidoreductase